MSRDRGPWWRSRLFLLTSAAVVVVAVAAIVLLATTKGSGLPYLRTASPNVTTTYDPDKFGGWKQVDCIRRRDQVLMNEAEPGTLERDRCSVLGGRWTDRWTGKVIKDAHQIHIDHTVPKKNAWQSGAWRWGEHKLHKYMNDLRTDHLVVMRPTINEQKGDKGPDEWKPADKGVWCDYARTWARIKHTWKLTVTRAELRALEEMVSTC